MRMYCHWLRALTSTPDSYERSASWRRAPEPGSTEGTALPAGAVECIIPCRGAPGSVIANPWIQIAVRDVGDQVEDDHHGRVDHQPGHDRVGVVRSEGGQEVETHAVEGEDDLRDD